MLNFYADESCKDGHQFLVIGGIAVNAAEEPRLRRVLADVKERNGAPTTEVKWQKTSRFKLRFYKEFAGVFFELARDDFAHFHALHVDSRTFDHKSWNQGDGDLGFSKLTFQLLLHRVGRRYGDKQPITVYLDSRDTKHSPDEMRLMLNRELRKKHGIATDPFRRITFRDSKACDILQLNDLQVGALGHLKNQHHKRPGAAAHKGELAWHIIGHARRLEHPGKLNWMSAKRFTVWPFQFTKNRVPVA